jgi:hypothetical protein
MEIVALTKCSCKTDLPISKDYFYNYSPNSQDSSLEIKEFDEMKSYYTLDYNNVNSTNLEEYDLFENQFDEFDEFYDVVIYYKRIYRENLNKFVKWKESSCVHKYKIETKMVVSDLPQYLMFQEVIWKYEMNEKHRFPRFNQFLDLTINIETFEIKSEELLIFLESLKQFKSNKKSVNRVTLLETKTNSKIFSINPDEFEDYFFGNVPEHFKYALSSSLGFVILKENYALDYDIIFSSKNFDQIPLEMDYLFIDKDGEKSMPTLNLYPYYKDAKTNYHFKVIYENVSEIDCLENLIENFEKLINYSITNSKDIYLLNNFSKLIECKTL